MTPTKADSLLERLQHTFGDKTLREELRRMMGMRDPLEFLTDDARDSLIRNLLADHRTARRYAALSRAHYRSRKAS